MKINSVTLTGFQSYRETETVDLSGLDLAVVSGLNGSGKTTLLNAIEWALWGKFRGEVVKSVIARGEPRAEVGVEFVVNDTTYRVIRTRTSTDRHEVVLQTADASNPGGWKELTEKNPPAADPVIAELLGMTWATARATWIIGQNDFGTFCELPPAQRRTVLSDAFGLNHYTTLAEQAAANRTKATGRQTLLAHDLETLNLQSEALNAEGPFPDDTDHDLEERGKRAEAEAEECATALAALSDPALESAVTSAESALKEYLNTVIAAQQRHAADVARAERAVAQATTMSRAALADKAKVDDALWEIDDAQAAVEVAEQAVATAEAAVEAVGRQVADLDAQVAALAAEQESVKGRGQESRDRIGPLKKSQDSGEGECFTCLQPLTVEQITTLVREQEENLESLLGQYRTLEERRLKAIADATKAARDRQAATQQVTRLRTEAQRAHGVVVAVRADAERADAVTAAVDLAAQGLADARTALAEIGEAPAVDESKRAALQASVDAAQEALTAARGDAGDRATLRERRDRARAVERQVWQEQERRVRVAEEKVELKAKIADAAAKVTEADRDVLHYTTLYDAFRPSGIPAMILAGVVEELNEEANDVLATLSPSLAVNVATQREKAKGGAEEKVTVYVVTADGQVDYSTLSGSEKFRIALALRIALSRCIARRTGTPIETIILDEGWGNLDEEFKKAVADVLIRLSADFSVFTVSHIEDVKESFPVVIAVDKTTGTSRVTITGR